MGIDTALERLLGRTIATDTLNGTVQSIQIDTAVSRLLSLVRRLPTADEIADAVIAKLPAGSPDAALIRQVVAEELAKLQLTTVAAAEPPPTR